MSGTVPVYDDNSAIIGRVEYNEKLDFWDGHNFTCGQTGRHLGYTRLKKSGKWVLIHGTQWQGEQSSAHVCSAEELIQAAIRTDNISDLLADYPELQDVYDMIDSDDDEIQTTVIDAVVNEFGNGAHVIVPREHLGKNVKITIYG
jgi:putative transposon-encoded protein